MALFRTRINVKESGTSEGDVFSFDFQDNLDVLVSGETAEIDATGGGTIDLTVVNGSESRHKTADESVTSSTALQDDNHLMWSIVAGRVYFFQMSVRAFTSGAGGFKLALGGTATVTNLRLTTHTVLASGATTFESSATLDGPWWDLGGATNLVTRVSGWVDCSGSGTFGLRWAQNTSSGTASSVLDFSEGVMHRRS